MNRKMIADEITDIAKMIMADKKSYGKPLSSNVLNALGEIIPYYIDSDLSLKRFWDTAHPDWSSNVKAYLKNGIIVLVCNDKNHTEIDLNINAPEYRWQPDK